MRPIARILPLACSLALAGCDPGVHFGYEKDFNGSLDYNCIGHALRSVAPDVSRTTWVDPDRDNDGFPRGTVVTQFNYSDPSLHGTYMLNVARLGNGWTHYEHIWSKLGTDVAQEERR